MEATEEIMNGTLTEVVLFTELSPPPACLTCRSLLKSHVGSGVYVRGCAGIPLGLSLRTSFCLHHIPLCIAPCLLPEWDAAVFIHNGPLSDAVIKLRLLIPEGFPTTTAPVFYMPAGLQHSLRVSRRSIVDISELCFSHLSSTPSWMQQPGS